MCTVGNATERVIAHDKTGSKKVQVNRTEGLDSLLPTELVQSMAESASTVVMAYFVSTLESRVVWLRSAAGIRERMSKTEWVGLHSKSSVNTLRPRT